MGVSTRRVFIQNVLKGALSLQLMQMSSCFIRNSKGNSEKAILPSHPAIKFQVISKVGSKMTDGNFVPGSPDGMTCFKKINGDYILIRNHELDNAHGGVTSILLDQDLQVKEEKICLSGTSRNCSGGATSWSTWLSCEEDFSNTNKRHGYVYEVDPERSPAENNVPLLQMGRFVHEACGLHVQSGFIYMTEDRDDSCFYRFKPFEKGNLKNGGVLQALVLDTNTFSNTSSVKVGQKFLCSWVDLVNPDSDVDNLRYIAQQKGAAIFVRGEGIAVSGDDIFFSCTSGGENRLGQIFVYQHNSVDKGSLELLYQPERENLLQNPDNLTFNQFGDLIICEDGPGTNRILGLTPDKKIYEIAVSNAGEWAGPCLSPDNKFLFVNLQEEGLTIAFDIPWEDVRPS